VNASKTGWSDLMVAMPLPFGSAFADRVGFAGKLEGRAGAWNVQAIWAFPSDLNASK
jgi:hypothetical protein